MSRNIMQDINLTVTFGTILMMGDSMRKMSASIENVHMWVFALLFCLLRLKMFADDHAHFAKFDNSTSARFGFLFGLLSWLLFYASATALPDFAAACLWMIAGLAVSTLWILWSMITAEPHKERRYWLVTNIIYIGILSAFYAAAPHLPLFPCALALIATFTLFTDYVKSKSFANLTE